TQRARVGTRAVGVECGAASRVASIGISWGSRRRERRLPTQRQSDPGPIDTGPIFFFWSLAGSPKRAASAGPSPARPAPPHLRPQRRQRAASHRPPHLGAEAGLPVLLVEVPERGELLLGVRTAARERAGHRLVRPACERPLPRLVLERREIRG